ncbi:MAG: prepilin-type N-terminal cleavage/methylation domain-containing protein [Proteobacteria bacterium]|nr:prepilin-type N-terminal cleavage/methylation domain-containing protein [Pseudomonadota bacterium]
MSNDKKWRCRQQQGFTLIEVMIALFIFLVIALGLARGEIAALRAQSDNSYRDQALRMAEDQLNDLRGQSPLTPRLWADASNRRAIAVPMRGGEVSFSQSSQITNIVTPAKTFILLEVAIGWNQGNGAPLPETNRNRQISLSTIIPQ